METKQRNRYGSHMLKALALLSGLLLSACGGNHIILNLDLDSFVDPDEALLVFTLPGSAPGESVEVYSEINTIRMPKGADLIVAFDAMALDLEVATTNVVTASPEFPNPTVPMTFEIELFIAEEFVSPEQ